MEPSLEKMFKKVDLVVLLSALLLFSLGVGLLHGVREQDISSDTLYQEALLLLETESPSQVATLLMGYPQQLFPTLKIILDQEHGFFTRDDKIRLIFKLLRRIPDKKTQFQLLNMLASKEKLLKGTPLLYIAAQGKKTPQTIPIFLEWTRNYLKKKSMRSTAVVQILKNASADALHAAIGADDMMSVKNLVNNGVIITPDLATNLILQVVKEDQDPAMITYFKQFKPNLDVEYPDKKGITPLIQAVDNANKEMVQALLQAGASANFPQDPTIKTPLQHAINLRETDIDALLRRYGAREGVPDEE